MHPLFLLTLGVLLLGAAACESNQQPAEKARDAPTAVAPPRTTQAEAQASGGWHGAVDTTRQAPAGIAVKGKLLEARRWTDEAGENALVVYRTGPAAEKRPEMEGEQFVELFARQYVRPPGGAWRELWRLQDAVRKCPFDMWLGTLPRSTRITDLDADGTTETTLVYKLTCRSDVSPSNLKLVMHEGPTKYALRGYMVVTPDSVPLAQRMPANACCIDTLDRKALANDLLGFAVMGRYENEKEFRAAPPAFLRFARRQWQRWAAQDQYWQLADAENDGVY
ncbi:M949_RS01915 family surface polysaccharide biosynthesis protein [Hymenobacter koreensis]|uniref:Lipoprotein n=1 Tax=Hymenobacter koreensis TaxID=1084523 RepID=A0ABP8IXD6_9BACT